MNLNDLSFYINTCKVWKLMRKPHFHAYIIYLILVLIPFIRNALNLSIYLSYIETYMSTFVSEFCVRSISAI